jgi:hypothetical protein
LESLSDAERGMGTVIWSAEHRCSALSLCSVALSVVAGQFYL